MYQERSAEGLVVDLGMAAHTLTRALDYVGVDDHSHGRRVGLISHRIARALELDQEARHFILLAGMLHDCGVSSTHMHQRLADELEWEGAWEHCDRGAFFMESFPPFSKFATVIKYHHTRWNRLDPALAYQVRLSANLIYLADRLDVLYTQHCEIHNSYDVIHNYDPILKRLKEHVGTLFAPALFEALLIAVQKDSFWFELKNDFLDEAIFESLKAADHKVTLSFDEIEAMGELISQIVDAKSPFTHYHSLRVADLVFTMGGYMGLPQTTRRMLRISGLLHDVGKLRTPDAILEKPGKLSLAEYTRIKRHSMDSKRVLNALFPDSLISKWASHHHEKLDGSGYPFGLKGDEIDLETRILTVCDIFQALCQVRPYRTKLSLSEVVTIMTDMEKQGQLDPTVMQIMRTNGQELYQTAIREGAEWAQDVLPALASGQQTNPL